MVFQLPYYVDGDVKITQSNAILRHLARKYDMGMYCDIFVLPHENTL